MNIDRVAVKRQARDTIQTSKPNAVAVGFVFLVLSIIIGLLSSRLTGVSLDESDLQSYLNYVVEEDFDAAVDLITDSYSHSPVSYLLDLTLQLLLALVSAGFVIFLLNTIRRANPCFGNLLDGFGMAWRIIVLNILEGLFILLWSLLLVVPGIIAAYRYRQAIYILIDNPDKSPLQCIQESKIMMAGHKLELFVFDLSFIGWWLLLLIPVVGYAVEVWTTPYFGMSRAIYYETLCGRSPSDTDTVLPYTE